MPKVNLNRVPMPAQDPKERAKNFKEVALGYTPEQFKEEASRCIQCPKRPCIGGCPVGIHIPDFIKAISEDNLPEAVTVLKNSNALPAVCGRVCPQESQCEKVCTLAARKAPVAIGRLERYLADWERANKPSDAPPVTLPKPTGKKVAVVGSGPSGLTAAAELAKLGHKVTIFEALHVAGGVLVYGIPEFRLPKKIVQAEVDYIKRLGVEFHTDALIGRLFTPQELFDRGFDAVFIGSGAGLPTFLGIPGENLSGIYSSNEFLIRVNLMKSYRFPEFDTPIRVGRRVVVVGGGNTAMDAARTALRLCPEEVTIIYRRSREELPARVEEVHHGEEEGLKFRLLTNPVRFIGDAEGRLKAVECLKMELGEPDESGRRRPVPVKGSEFCLECDVAIISIGNGANPLIPQTTPDVKLNKWGNITIDVDTGKTSKKGVFAGGDIVRGGATVILAMGDGRRAANSMHEYLMTGVWQGGC